jgi:hypothetical protein
MPRGARSVCHIARSPQEGWHHQTSALGFRCPTGTSRLWYKQGMTGRRYRNRVRYRLMFSSVGASEAERNTGRAGDALVEPADVVMDRAFTLEAPREAVWPWLVQLGKGRAGWYLPRAIERFLPGSRRAARSLNLAWLRLEAGDVVPDYGGRNETFQVALITPPAALVYRSQRGRTSLTWSLVLEPAGSEPGRTRVFLRLRMAPVRHKLLARTAGELIDVLTVAGMAAGLAERLRGHDGAT